MNPKNAKYAKGEGDFEQEETEKTEA